MSTLAAGTQTAPDPGRGTAAPGAKGTAPGRRAAPKGVPGWEIGVATIGPSQHELFPEPQAAFHPLRHTPLPVVVGTATRRSTRETGLSPSLGFELPVGDIEVEHTHTRAAQPTSGRLRVLFVVVGDW